MEPRLGGCGPCICKDCMRWWQGKCPHGGCYDELRAKTEPWEGPVRKGWTDWDLPGEQAHWCRGGVFYPAESCGDHLKYQEPVVRYCLTEAVTQWADGTIICGMADSIGCAECMRRFEEREGENDG